MNKTKIEWADMTWNPVTGCLHGCDYCYARKIIHRFNSHYFVNKELHKLNEIMTRADDMPEPIHYPFGFDPTLHRYRLDEPQKIKKPKNIFVCSMADLFGRWVPDEWIEAVFEACAKAPQHRYIFLTKNPKRYEKINRHMPSNMHFGWTQTNPREVSEFTTQHSMKVFVSIEPIQAEFNQFYPNNLEWVIIGAETGNRKGKIIPKREWIENIVKECEYKDIPVFMKNSLASIWQGELVQQFPWGAANAKG